VESISNTVFDKRIIDYKDAVIKSETERASPIQTSPVVPTQPIYNAERSSDKSSKQEISKTKEGSVISKVMESVLGPNVALVPIQLPQNTPIVSPSPMTTEKVSSLENQVNQVKENEKVESNSTISSVANSIKQVEGSIGLLSNILREKERTAENKSNNFINESLSFLGLIPSNATRSIEKLNQATVQSEKATSQSSSLQEMTNKVVGTEIISPLKTEVTSIIQNMGNSVSNAITTALMKDKKTAEEKAASIQPSPVKPSTSTSIVNEGQKTENQLQAPTVQSFMSGGNAPSVVSLTQSTIDNLASAIIKSMSISPFLNSGR
jgi:hypothetical protein